MIRDRVFKIREQIASVCSRILRNPSGINIVAVSKGRSLSQIEQAIDSGICYIGENRVQEALLKYSALQSKQLALSIKWQMVGHLQSNKVKDAVKMFSCIQSVDGLGLAVEIDRQAQRAGKVQDIMLEIKTSEEPAKFGLKPQELQEAILKMVSLKNLKILGLMTIAPLTHDPENTRPYFRRLRELRDELNQSSIIGYKVSELSMGMSDDFTVAIEEGSTMVRLGRAIFE